MCNFLGNSQGNKCQGITCNPEVWSEGLRKRKQTWLDGMDCEAGNLPQSEKKKQSLSFPPSPISWPEAREKLSDNDTQASEYSSERERKNGESLLENWHRQATRANQRSRCCLSSISEIKRNGIAVMHEYSKNIGKKSDMADKRDRKIISGKKTYSKSRRNFLNLTHSMKELNENTKKINESS